MKIERREKPTLKPATIKLRQEVFDQLESYRVFKRWPRAEIIEVLVARQMASDAEYQAFLKSGPPASVPSVPTATDVKDAAARAVVRERQPKNGKLSPVETGGVA